MKTNKETARVHGSSIPTETEDRVKSNIGEAMQTLERCKCKFVSGTDNFDKVNGHLIGCKYSKHD